MAKARAVTVIPATTVNLTSGETRRIAKRRVAAYARVSTENDEQLSSYEAQVDYYTRYIKERNDWEFAGIYTDEGISGTNTKNREGFKNMISDALNGKIDLILTKSVSRFARNTVDTLTTVRLLKDKDVEVYFEKENIYTMDSKGELLITIMSSLAQEESRSISENVTWGIRKSFADGKVMLPYKRFLGYDKGEDGLPVINEEEAAIVRQIYRLFLEGKTPYTISKYLTEQCVPTPGGQSMWCMNTIKSILNNEKYKGDAVLQKTYTVDFLSKKKKINKGEIPQYYVQNSHPAIISNELYDLVQNEIQRRANAPATYSGTDIFSSKIICGECGGFYGRKVWHSKDKYRRIIYRCNNKYKDNGKCKTPHVDEDTIKQLFIKEINSLIENKDEIINNFENIKKQLFGTESLEEEAEQLKQEINVVAEVIKKLVEDNARIAIQQDDYTRQYNSLVERMENAKSKYIGVLQQIQDLKARKENYKVFMKTLKAQETLITEFDEELWNTTVDNVTVIKGNNIKINFRTLD